MWAEHTRFARWGSAAWDRWRHRERKGKGVVRYCGDCGRAHRARNHFPEKGDD